MAGLTSTGTLTYNGVRFTGAHSIDVQTEYVYDKTRRRVIAHRLTFTVSWVVDGSASELSADMDLIRFKLGQAGGKLIFEDKGFGKAVRVNTGTIKNDLEQGPHPEILTWDVVADNRAVEVVWRCVTTIRACPLGRLQGVKEVSWGIGWRIDRHGDTTRTLSGTISIVGQGIGKVTADAARDAFAPLPVPGFTREQEWVLNEAKDMIAFSIVDTQIPSGNPYPAGITEIEASHRVSYRRGKEGKRVYNTISATIRPEASLDGHMAWQVFLTIAGQRLFLSRAARRHPFLISLDLDESIFGRTHAFRLVWRHLASVDDIVRNTALFANIGTNWKTWTESLRQSAFSSRGTGRMLDIPPNDHATDLCVGNAPPIIPNNVVELYGRAPTKPPSVLRNKTPDPDYSFLDFEGKSITLRDRPVLRQSFLQKPDETKPGSFDANRLGGVPGIPASYGRQSGSVKLDVIQEGGASRYYQVLLGGARRAGHKIPRPRMDKVGSMDPVEQFSFFEQSEDGDYFGVPVYRARWAVAYALPGNPGHVDVLPDQMEVKA